MPRINHERIKILIFFYSLQASVQRLLRPMELAFHHRQIEIGQLLPSPVASRKLGGEGSFATSVYNKYAFVTKPIQTSVFFLPRDRDGPYHLVIGRSLIDLELDPIAPA